MKNRIFFIPFILFLSFCGCGEVFPERDLSKGESPVLIEANVISHSEKKLELEVVGSFGLDYSNLTQPKFQIYVNGWSVKRLIKTKSTYRAIATLDMGDVGSSKTLKVQVSSSAKAGYFYSNTLVIPFNN